MFTVCVQTAPFDPAAEVDALRAGNPQIGAVVTFLGLMRDLNDGERVEAMTLEHYPGMTERALEAIVAEAAGRWALEGVRVVHRVGELRPEEPIVLVAVASRHRGEALFERGHHCGDGKAAEQCGVEVGLVGGSRGWRKLAACGRWRHRKLEAHATCPRFQPFSERGGDQSRALGNPLHLYLALRLR